MALDDDALGELLDRLGIDLNSVAPEIDPPLDALIRQSPKAALERAAADAAEAVWSDELEAELAQELREFREEVLDEDLELAPTIDAALAELARAEEGAKAIARFLVSLPPDPEAGSRELDRATARLTRTLATDKRRVHVRASLAELARGFADEFRTT